MPATTANILIIGASAAGITAAKEIRRVNPSVALTIITDEPYLPYYRPFLTEYLGEPDVVMQKPNFYLNPAAWYEAHNMRLLLNTKATAIDATAKTVRTATQQTLPYDKLIIATGSKPFVPQPELLYKENVFAIRTLDDAKAVEQYAATVQHATVIGGGLLGIETASSLLKKNLKVTMIEYMKRILPMQLDEEGSLVFESIIQDNGIELRLGTSAESFSGQSRVTGVKLGSGLELQTDMVIFSIGVRANLELAATCGLKTNRGILVNERMETSLPDIYACGDVAEYGRNVALWAVATDQGKVAGLNASGETARFTAENYPARLQAFDTRLFSIGDLGKESSLKEYLTMRQAVPDEFIYKQLYLKGDKITGGILIGDIKKSSKLLKAVNQAAPTTEAFELLR